MVSRLSAAAQAMRSRPCADVILPCSWYIRHVRLVPCAFLILFLFLSYFHLVFFFSFFFFLYSLKSLFGTRIKFVCMYLCIYVIVIS